MQGRRVGTEGHRRGTAYIEREVRRLGLVPAGDSGGYFQNLPVFERTLVAAQRLSVGGSTFTPWVDFLPRDNGPGARDMNNAPVVFGGVWGDTATMISPSQAAGKFIVITIPDAPDGKPRWQANRPALTKYYEDATAIAIASFDAIDPESRQTLSEPAVGMQLPESDTVKVPAFLYVSRNMATALLGTAPRGVTRGQASGRTVTGTMRFSDTRAPARNVVAILPGSDPALKGEYVAIGAHNDHIGFERDPVDHDSLRAFNAVVRPGGEDDPRRCRASAAYSTASAASTRPERIRSSMARTMTAQGPLRCSRSPRHSSMHRRSPSGRSSSSGTPERRRDSGARSTSPIIQPFHEIRS
jgi:hypothetical protein